MPKYGAVIALLLLMSMVICRAKMLKRQGLTVFVFAKTHRSDLMLPPVVAFFIYHLFAHTFDLPRIQTPLLMECAWMEWVGLLSCILGLGLFLWGLISFGKSFRVGIDDEHPDELITTGAFAISRNPLYVAFIMELTGFFCIFPNVIFLIAILGGFWLFRRQILREEKFLKSYYGKAFEEYCQKVRRYL